MTFKKGDKQTNPNSLKALKENGHRWTKETIPKKCLDNLKKDKIGNEYFKGKTHTEEWKKAQSLRSKKMWADPEYRKNHIKKLTGRKVSAETCKNISDGKTGGTRPPIKESTRLLLREKRLHQVFPVKDTKIEIKTQEYLTEKGVLFQTHLPIIGQPDIFIKPEKYA